MDEPRVIQNRYVVIRKLGEGTSSVVWLCEDQESKSRLVALKELRVELLEDWKHLELFERGARVLGSLRHHGVPESYDNFKLKDAQGRERLVLVEEYIEGVSLLERINTDMRMGYAELVQMTLGLLDILDYLHSRTPPIFHRDIKPSNIIIRPTGAPVLIDFGGVRDGWTPMSEGSTVVATHGYTPSEQYMGQVSAASDFYALGATLLHVIGGKPPYTYPFDSGRIELPEALPTQKAMHTLVARMLEPAPNQRLKSAEEARALLLKLDTVPRTSAPNFPTVEPTLPRTFANVNAPRFVDMGQGPRDTHGPFRDIYKDLIHQHSWQMIVFLSLLSFGVAIPLLLFAVLRLSARMTPLFKEGVFTTGRIISGHLVQSTYRLIYEFEYDGKMYRGSRNFMQHPSIDYFSPGASIGVLYDASDPSKNTAVFRYGAVPKAKAELPELTETVQAEVETHDVAVAEEY